MRINEQALRGLRVSYSHPDENSVPDAHKREVVRVVRQARNMNPGVGISEISAALGLRVATVSRYERLYRHLLDHELRPELGAAPR